MLVVKFACSIFTSILHESPRPIQVITLSVPGGNSLHRNSGKIPSHTSTHSYKVTSFSTLPDLGGMEDVGQNGGFLVGTAGVSDVFDVFFCDCHVHVTCHVHSSSLFGRGSQAHTRSTADFESESWNVGLRMGKNFILCVHFCPSYLPRILNIANCIGQF